MNIDTPEPTSPESSIDVSSADQCRIAASGTAEPATVDPATADLGRSAPAAPELREPHDFPRRVLLMVTGRTPRRW